MEGDGMRIASVHIKNFRILENIEVAFDAVTTFVGPNGAGKSSILRALDWFFNGTKGASLTLDDVYRRDPERVVTVEVTFNQLTDADRSHLGKYAPGSSETVSLWRRWHDGEDKMFGEGRTFAGFDTVRGGGSATERRTLWQALRTERPELDLRAWSNDAAMTQLMAEWEQAHPDELTDADVETTSHFFGFAGQAVMSGLFDFIFVSADLRAAEETTYSRTAVIGRILEQAVDRTELDAELAELVEGFGTTEADIHRRLLADQLHQLSSELTAAVEEFATGRAVAVTPRSEPLKPQRVQFDVSVLDSALETRVERQGHGFQRALLIAALKMLGERGRREATHGVMCLAIEEPELFQHPLQARSFAAVLRGLAEDVPKGVQVSYATHSPYFIEAKSFHQVRRVTRQSIVGGASKVIVRGSTVGDVVARLSAFLDPESIQRQLDGVCLGALGEGFFADVVLLVEGSTDRAVLAGAAARDSVPLLLDGIFIGEAGGKTRLLLPYAIFDEIGIPVYLVADNDSHLRDELRDVEASGDQMRARKLSGSVKESIEWNRKLQRFFGLPECDWPVGRVAANFTFVDGGLEQALEKMWPGWAEAKQALIEDGVGFSGKDSATYQEAALHAPGEVPELVQSLIAGVRALRIAA